MDASLQLATEIERNVLTALMEDIGNGDLTAQLTPGGRQSLGTVLSRQDAVLAGQAWFDACFQRLDPAAEVVWTAKDGELIKDRRPLGMETSPVCLGPRSLGEKSQRRLGSRPLGPTGASSLLGRRSLAEIRELSRPPSGRGLRELTAYPNCRLSAIGQFSEVVGQIRA